MTAKARAAAAGPAEGSLALLARERLGSLPGPANARTEALRRFEAAGLPTRRDEAWRYTPLGDLARATFAEAPAREVSPRDVPALDGAAATLVLVNGRFAPALSRLPSVPGLTVAPLAEAVRRDPALLPPPPGEDHAFAALSAALWRDGALVRLAPRATVEAPVHLVFVTVPGAGPEASHPRVYVVAGEGSRGLLVETHATVGSGPALQGLLATVALGAGAHLEHLKVIESSPEAWHVATVDTRLERDARLDSTVLTLGGRLARTETRVLLGGSGASCRLDGAWLAGQGHVEHQTSVDHAVPHGTSRQLQKGILAGKATSAFSGHVLVRPDAQKTDAHQANHNLLLSREAKAHTKPGLRIFADDVKCAHGATVGQLDDDAVFYLRTRGIGEAEARRLLLEAFLAEVVDRVGPTLRPHAAVRLKAALAREARP
jgi:Fe-S cluster assembly protein SufD